MEIEGFAPKSPLLCVLSVGLWLMLPSTPSHMEWAQRTRGMCHPMWDTLRGLVLHGLVLHELLATVSGPFCLAGGISADKNSTISSTGNLSNPLGSSLHVSPGSLPPHEGAGALQSWGCPITHHPSPSQRRFPGCDLLRGISPAPHFALPLQS